MSFIIFVGFLLVIFGYHLWFASEAWPKHLNKLQNEKDIFTI